MPEDLLARLQNLETSYYNDKQLARQNDFMSRYGNRFSNNKGLGIAILNELDARGVDTSAADEAVQSILDELRMECEEILNSLKVVQEAAVANMEKLDTVADVIDKQLAADTDTTMMDAGAGVPEEPAPEEPAPEEPVPAPEESAAEEPAPEEPAPEEPAPAAEEPLPPNQVTSDARMKRINRMKSNWSAKRANREASSWKPSTGILSAAQGGM